MNNTKHNVYTSIYLVNNIHCNSCIEYARDVLKLVMGIVYIDISIIDHKIHIKHVGNISHQIAQHLVDAAFEVEYVDSRDQNGAQVHAYTTRHETVTLPSTALTWRPFLSRSQRLHLKTCAACRETRTWKAIRRRVWSAVVSGRTTHIASDESRAERGQSYAQWHNSEASAGERTPSTLEKTGSHESSHEDVYTTTLSIRGMTCASCVSSITAEVKRLDGVETVNVNLLTNTAKVTHCGPRSRAEAIVRGIEDVGFEAQVERSHKPDGHKAKISIEGMTCGSCTGQITRAVNRLSCVTAVDVDLVGSSATVVFDGRKNLDCIIEAIEDSGFGASVVEVGSEQSIPQASRVRVVKIIIAGMYCPNCPSNITSALYKAFADDITIGTIPTLDHPILELSYQPSLPTLTIRSILRAIDCVDESISASVYHPPSLEQRSHDIYRRERHRILRHLVATLVIAIPTFIIGIVYMDLVPASNTTRQWFTQPIWAGRAMRIDWTMFILTTPAMFYGAAVFHSKAVKEIMVMWRPRNKVPLLRRFYRFGSMNLLLSLATSVAYFASLAVLIMDATTSPDNVMGADNRTSTTYFDTVTFLTLFILCGRFLEAYSKAKTGDAVAMLANLRPTDAILTETDASTDRPTTMKIPTDQLEVGDQVTIPHGVSPPVDGIVEQTGNFLFDETSLTGESRPVKKCKGDTVLTGSINISDAVQITVTQLGGKSMLDQIVEVVRDGQAKRAPIERLADVLTGYFTPVIVLLAISTWVIWLALGASGALPSSWLDVNRGGWAYWSVEFAIAVFVVACPCGIGLAAPTALFVGGGLAAKQGILVQGGGQAFQEASRLDTIVFDKTGTLTEGKMRVTQVEYADRLDLELKSIALLLAKGLETASTHPIAAAIAEWCDDLLESDGPNWIHRAEVEEIAGMGMKGTFHVQTAERVVKYEACIGNERVYALLSGRNATSRETSSPTVTASSVLTASTSRFQGLGCSTAMLALRAEGESTFTPLAVFAITDPIRQEAPAVLATLRSHNIAVHMCTGDNQTTAHAIAAQLDIPVSHVRAAALPQDKATYIHNLQHPDHSPKRKIVAFVGDGTNDTPALTVCDVSIAISHIHTNSRSGATGSDIAMTSSSFILLNANLTSILTLVQLSRRVFHRVKLNFAWAALYNLCLIPVAAGVFFALGADWDPVNGHGGFRLSPVWASAAMAGSSVSVVLSSLALKLPESEMGPLIRLFRGRSVTATQT